LDSKNRQAKQGPLPAKVGVKENPAMGIGAGKIRDFYTEARINCGTGKYDE